MTYTGYIDESVHDSLGLYVVGMVIAEPLLGSVAKEALSPLVPSRRRPHWHDEEAGTRLKMARAVGTLEVEARVYLCWFDRPRRKEEARGRALRWLAWDLDPETRYLLLDRRQDSQQRKDRQTLSAVAGRPPRFGYEHRSSECEPLLWSADIVAGAIAADRVVGDEGYQVELGAVLTAVEEEP